MSNFNHAYESIKNIIVTFQISECYKLNRKCERLDKEIDQLDYNLYGLTDEEIKIVEGK
jgi:hypothetical protein